MLLVNLLSKDLRVLLISEALIQFIVVNDIYVRLQ